MAVRRGPTLRSQLLGRRLRGLREGARLTLRDVGEYIQRDASTISRFEAGLLPARVSEVLAYLDICGVDDPDRREALKRLSHDAFSGGWWDEYADDLSGTLVDRIWLESRSSGIRAFEAQMMPGLTQTRQYAEAVIRAADPDAKEEQIERWVEVRMLRQRLLTGERPIRLAAVIDEAVLRRRVGGARVMRDQLNRLVEVAELPNVELRILPAAAGAHASPEGSFEIFDVAEPYPEIGYVATPAGEVCVEGAAIDRLREAYERLCAASHAGDEAVAFVLKIAKGMR